MRTWGQLDPRYRKVIGWVAVFGMLVLTLSVMGLAAPADKAPLGGPTAATTTTPRRATPVAVRLFTVAAVVDGRTVVGSDGEQWVVEGLGQPGPCWAEAALNFANMTLLGKQVRVDADIVTLPDGEDVAVLMVSRGLGRMKAGARAEIATAQEMARFANLGLWGAPCAGSDTPAPPPPPPPPPATTTTVAPPPPPPPPAPSTPTPPPVYYANCYEAAMARALPLYAGQPGYRRELDPDGDGIACNSQRR